MKKTFTLLTAVLLAATNYAFPNSSRISITSGSNASTRIMIDGNKYRADNNSFVLNNLTPGYHAIKVYQQKKNHGRNNIFGNGNYQLVYSANVYVKPQYHVDITINRFGKAFFDEQPINTWNNGNDDDDWGDDGNGNYNWNNNYDNTGRAMNAQSFNRFKESLNKEVFENTRMNISKQVIASDYFTTAQIKELMESFSFENNKLEIAKYAYKYTVDKREYYSVADAFTFSSNKEELLRYIQNYK
ncbi:MAG: DUF4476 domain-containing protein [Chitinophagaceae bacterium]|nr:DUF4476 domain-containing protein [Chitinophagaceae bacterium]